MKRFFIFLFVPLSFILFSFSLGKKNSPEQATAPKHQEEIQEIECQIEKLQKIKKGYESKALYHENQAERLQFIQQEMQTAKKHWIMAEENREIAKKIQKDIDQLEEKKQELLKKYG
ncbi:MAG TPA: hypothetical protein VLG44_05010 [Chlamydiales bacterium]|nr:hypothetical protein [Chlamydiales bacterium]